MNHEEIRERLKAILADNGYSVNSYSKESGIPQRTLNKQINEDGVVSYNIISNIISKFPNISLKWLMLGEGEMYYKNNYTVTELYNSLVPEQHEMQTVPLYDIDAAANLKTMFENKSQNIVGALSIPNLPKVDGAMSVRGDSMYPLLKSGDIIVYKILSDISFVIPGEMYVVSYTWDDDEYVVVKYVNKSSIPGYYTLVSYNSHHDPMDIPAESIRAIALVKASVRYNTIK